MEKKDSSNVWLLTALASCTQSEIEDVTIQEQFEYPKAFEEFETSENGNSNHQPELDLSGESCIEFIKEEFRDQSCCIVSSRTECKTWEEKLKTDCLDIATDSSSNVLASISTFSSQSFSDYLIEAARFLKLAQECESNNSFGEAFDHYKTVIGTLLSNVQGKIHGQLSRIVCVVHYLPMPILLPYPKQMI